MLAKIYEDITGSSCAPIPDEGLEKVAASSLELAKEAQAYGKLMARAVVERQLVQKGYLR